MGIEVREPPRCIHCGTALHITEGAAQVVCHACGYRMEIAGFTQEDRCLTEAIERAAQQVQDAVARSDGLEAEHRARLEELIAGQRSAQAHQLQKLYEMGDGEQRLGRYEEAIKVYRQLLLLSPAQEAELHWRILLCRYGVEYVYEQDSGQYLPTITAISAQSVLDDPDYLAAVQYARSQEVRCYYQEQAEALERILRKYREICATQPPCDVFITVKQGDGAGNPTQDSLVGMELYMDLTARGLRVFNSRKSLEGCAGLDYEPYVMAALSTARVLIVLGSTAEYLEAPWVANEWRRFRWLMKDGTGRRLIPYLIGLPANQLPVGLSGVQAISNQNAEPMKELYRNLSDVFGSRFDARQAEQSRDAVVQELVCPFCGTRTILHAGTAMRENCACCSACGHYAAPADVHTELVQRLEEALALREQREFHQALERFAAIRTLYPGSRRAVLGETLAQLQAAFVPTGRGEELKVQLFAPPQEHAVDVLNVACSRLMVPGDVPSPEAQSALALLQSLRDMVQGYQQVADGPGWDVLLCCEAADRPAAAQLQGLLASWGFRTFLPGGAARGSSAREAGAIALHAALTARVMVAVASTSDAFYRPAMMNEALRSAVTGREIIPCIAGDEAEVPPEFNPYGVICLDEPDAETLLFSDLTRMLPEVAACSHEGQTLEFWQAGQGRIARRCVRCGCILAAEDPRGGEEAARKMAQCFRSLDDRNYPQAAEQARDAAKMLQNRMAAMGAGAQPALERQRVLAAYINFSANLGLKTYATRRGWQVAIGVTELPEHAALERQYRMLMDRLGDSLGDLLELAWQAACSISGRNAPARQVDVGLTLRMPADGGTQQGADFARLLTQKMRALGLLVSSAADLGDGSCWGAKEDEQHTAVFGSQWLLALAACSGDLASPEVRKQTDRMPAGRRAQVLELVPGAADGAENVRAVANCDEANATMLAGEIRQKCVLRYRRRIAEMWTNLRENAVEIRWYCERGMALRSGSEMREFQFRLAMLYAYGASPFHDAQRGVALLQEAARYGNPDAIAFCRKRGVTY